MISNSLLSLSVGALLLPAAYHFTIGTTSGTTANIMDEEQKSSILMMSHGVSIILIIGKFTVVFIPPV